MKQRSLSTESRGCRRGLLAHAVFANALAVGLLLTTLALPEPAEAVAYKPAGAATPKKGKVSASVRRPATSNSSRIRNQTIRATRSSRGRSSTRISNNNPGAAVSTPPGWRQSHPSMSADLRRGIARGVPLKSIPVKIPDAPPGTLKLSRHLMREPMPAGLGRVVPTQSLSQAQRDINDGLGYRGMQISPSGIERYRSLNRRPSDMRRPDIESGHVRLNSTAAQTRAAAGVSATKLSRNTADGGSASPPGWRHSHPAMPADLRRGIIRGVPLKSIPVKLPKAPPGTLKLSRHLTREPMPAGLGRVVPTQPLSQAQRDINDGLGYRGMQTSPTGWDTYRSLNRRPSDMRRPDIETSRVDPREPPPKAAP